MGRRYGFRPVRRRSRVVRLAELAALAVADPHEALAAVLDSHGWADIAGFALARNLDPAGLELGLSETLLGPVGRRIGIRSDRPS